MPETYGQPEDEPTRTEQAKEAAMAMVAGNGTFRTTLMYAVAFVLVISPIAPLAVVPLALLIATDRRLA
jgi:hypothetical protein